MLTVSQALLSNDAAFQALLDAANEGIWVLDRQRETIHCNQALSQILNETALEIKNKSVFDYLSSPHFEECLHKALDTHQTRRLELHLNRHDGQEVCCSCSTTQIITPQGELIATFVMITDITERKKAEQALHESKIRMDQLSIFQQAALEMERKRIARELHDELGQTMTALHFDLKWLTENIDPHNETVHQKLKSMKTLVSRTVDSVRRISEDLRPGMLDDLGLAAAIEHQITKFSHQTGIKCELFVSETDFELQEQIATALFRIVQESLTNVARHSGADTVTVRLQELKEQVLLIIQDNGRGIPSTIDPHKKTYGLLGMRERIKVLNGTLDIFNEAGAGARIEVCVPKQLTT